jgi:hypothetical protein
LPVLPEQRGGKRGNDGPVEDERYESGAVNGHDGDENTLSV